LALLDLDGFPRMRMLFAMIVRFRASLIFRCYCVSCHSSSFAVESAAIVGNAQPNSRGGVVVIRRDGHVARLHHA
jgi:hypothetical protein